MPRQAQEVNKAAETDEQVPGGEVPQAQPAKRRGRPPKNAEPADQENEERNEKEEQEAPQKRRRGRPPKPKSALQADLARAIKEERYEDAAKIHMQHEKEEPTTARSHHSLQTYTWEDELDLGTHMTKGGDPTMGTLSETLSW